ncbi:MAG: hypothetical protein H6756_08435, partial [Candidatus Omnitrophica bacterium]|nr:hypothetical protein [Candidatus Omnitrophota bacterium]
NTFEVAACRDRYTEEEFEGLPPSEGWISAKVTRWVKQPAGNGDSSTDNAVFADDLGGIAMMDIPMQREGGGTISQDTLLNVPDLSPAHISGFRPVIINITPVPSILPLIGQNEETPRPTGIEVTRL